MSCVTSALKALPVETLKALSGLCDSAMAGLNIIKAQKQALLAHLDVQLIPMKAKQQLLNGAVNGIRQKVMIIPTETILMCPELGNINTMLEQAIVGQVEGFLNAAFEVDRMVSIHAEVSASLEDVDNAISYFESLVVDIKQVLSTS